MLSPRVRDRVSSTIAWNASALVSGASAAYGASALAWNAALAWGRQGLDGSEGGEPIGRIGSLEVRLATRRKEIRRAQRVRFKVFFEQGGAVPDPVSALQRRDICPFDAISDHLIVLDHEVLRRRMGVLQPKIVGTYRLLRQSVSARHSGFYTAQEFDVAPLLARHREQTFLELGRSCVLPDYRSRRTIELLWRGIWSYVQDHRVDVLIGCASFEGTDPDAHALPLSFLRHFARAEPAWQARALPHRSQEIALLAASDIDRRTALCALPPLVKGYLRAGARFGDGIVIDRQFGTTDVMAVLPIAALDRRYLAHFGTA